MILPVAIAHLCEYFISFLFFNMVFQPKKKSLTIGVIGLIMYAGVFAAYMIFDFVVVNILSTLIFNFVFGVAFFKCKIRDTVSCSLFLSAALTVSEFIVMAVVSIGRNNDINTYESSAYSFLLMALISKILYLIVVMFVGMVLPQSNSKTPAFLILFPIASMVTIYAIWSVSSKFHITKHDSLLITVASLSIIASIILTYIFYSKTEKKLEELYKAQNETEKIETDIAYYNILEQQNSNLRAYAHDTKNHLSAIKNLNTNPEIEMHISKMSESLAEYSKVCHSGNHTLDVVIDKYVTECKINGLNFEFDIKNNNLSKIEPYDTVTILGNLLDNAVEAAVKSTEKTVTFETDYRNDFSVIIISNSCDINPMTNGTELPVTTKSNRRLHGFGLKSVKNTVIKYNGDISFDYDDETKIFVVTIMTEN